MQKSEHSLHMTEVSRLLAVRTTYRSNAQQTKQGLRTLPITIIVMVEEFKSFRLPAAAGADVTTPTSSGTATFSTQSRTEALDTILGSLPQPGDAGFFTSDVGGLVADYALSDATEVANAEGTWRGTKLEHADAFRRQHKLDELQAAANAIYEEYTAAQAQARKEQLAIERLQREAEVARNRRDQLKREWNDANAALVKAFNAVRQQLGDRELALDPLRLYQAPAAFSFSPDYGLLEPRRNYLAHVPELAGGIVPPPERSLFTLTFATPAELAAADAPPLTFSLQDTGFDEFQAAAGAQGAGWSLAAPTTPTASGVEFMTARGAQGALVFEPELDVRQDDF